MKYQTLKKVMLCLGIGLGLAATAQAEESATKKSFQFQGNLEAAITNQKVVRTRALPTIIFSRGKYSAEYLGLHEMKNKNSMVFGKRWKKLRSWQLSLWMTLLQ